MQETVNHQILKLINQQVLPTPATLLYDLAGKLNYPIADFMHVVDSLIADKYIAKKNEIESIQQNAILFQFEESPRYIILPKGEDFIKSENQPKSNINISGNVIGSQVGNASNFGNLKSNHNQNSLEPIIDNQNPIEPPNVKANLSLWDKFVKFTDHKLFSILILTVLATIAGIIKVKMGWKF